MNITGYGPADACVPRGWIQDQMSSDLHSGFVGCLDRLVPLLIRDDDIYGRDRRGSDLKNLSLGLAPDDGLNETELQWWNSETQSQWRDGWLRHAFLLKNRETMAAGEKYVQAILDSADADGYLGIYRPEIRYRYEFEGGDLWAQTTLFRALLGYRDLAGREQALEAVRRGVDVTMRSYPPGHPAGTPLFCREQTHGLNFIDILERLYDLDGEAKYADYAAWLYEAYSDSPAAIGDDARRNHLLDESRPLADHGVHAWEHIRVLAFLARVFPNRDYPDLLNRYLEKAQTCICPSGGALGDEWIGGRSADTRLTGYEYCSLTEALHSWSALWRLTADPDFADRIENVFLNAAQGARHPTESAIAYLKTDDCYSMTGGFPFHQPGAKHHTPVRYKYSPVHQDAAVCCAPNAGRIHPYYLQAMWFPADTGLVKTCYGDSVFESQVNGCRVRIEESGGYPFSGELDFTVQTDRPEDFTISFRIPGWCREWRIDTDLETDSDPVDENGFIAVHGRWSGTRRIRLSFRLAFHEERDLQGRACFRYGALLLAVPIEHTEETVRTWPVPGFRDIHCRPAEPVPPDIQCLPSTLDSLELIRSGSYGDFLARGMMLRNGRPEPTDFRAIGGTVLRQVSFQDAPAPEPDSTGD